MARPGEQANVLKYKLAVAAARLGNDPLKLAHAVRHLADAYAQAHETSLAESCYLEALGIYRGAKGGRTLDLANTVRGLAVLKDDEGVADFSRQLWTEALDLYGTAGVQEGVAESAARLALAARRRQDLDESRDWLARARLAADAARDPDTFHFVREVGLRIEI